MWSINFSSHYINGRKTLLIFSYRVKFVAQTDLDEILVLNRQNSTLIDFLNSLLDDNPEIASASFVSRRAKPPISFESVKSPYELNLLELQNIHAEDYYFPRPLYTKHIRIPHRSFHAHIHLSMQNEEQPNSNKQYTTFQVANAEAYILHLRYNE